MSVEQEKVVDLIGDNEPANEVVLFIMDHLPWNEREKEHLMRLQTKINTYLKFIESGELIEKHPTATEKKKVIEVQAKFALSDLAHKFYEHARGNLKESGIELRCTVVE